MVPETGSASWWGAKRVGARLAGAVLALGLLALVARRVLGDWGALETQGLGAQLHLDPAPLAGAWLVQTLGFALMVAAWQRMLGPAAAGVPYVRHWRAHAVSGLAQVVPGSVWTPASRVALYRREGVAAVAVGAALVLEWLLVGLAGIVLYAGSAPWSVATRPRAAELAAVAAVGALVCLHPAVAGRVVARIAGRLGTAPPTVPPPRVLAWLGLLELGVLTLAGGSLYGVMAAMSPRASLGDAVAAFALTASVANLLAWLPGTGVVREAGFVLLLAPLYGSSVVALAVAIAWRIWLSAVQLSWAALGLALAARGPARRP